MAQITVYTVQVHGEQGGYSWSWILVLTQQAAEPKTWGRNGGRGKRWEVIQTLCPHIGHSYTLSPVTGIWRQRKPVEGRGEIREHEPS